jgi:hypothetical protein
MKTLLKTIWRFFKRFRFGFATEDFRHHHQLLCVWHLGRSWFEVYRWPVGTGNEDMHDALRPLEHGSPEAYSRIGFCAQRVYKGSDFRAAKNAMSN